MARVTLIAALLALASGGVPRVTADEPSPKDVVRRMGAYVETYGEKASIIVASERYTQRVAGGLGPAEDRVTVADFAIVRAAGFGGWVGFRDVVEVDGSRVSDREERLIQILTSAAGRMDEAQRLSNESARFNIGPIQRNFNVPTAGLFFFRPENLDRFRFTRKSVRDGTWEIGFRETSRPTLVRTPTGVSLPAEGSIWVNADTGTVVRTRIHMTIVVGQTRDDAGTGSAEIDVTYQRVPALDMWLPETMTEVYEGKAGNGPWRMFAEAKYSDYRQFQTSVRIK